MVDTLLSFDPGAVHCGVAIWVRRADPIRGPGMLRWKCQNAWEAATPEAFIDDVRDRLTEHLIDQVAGEGFWLQADKAMAQVGSPFGTVEVIGAVRHLCRWANTPFELVSPSDRNACFKRMKAVKYQFPKDSAGHVKSAVCVGGVATEWRAIHHFSGDGVG